MTSKGTITIPAAIRKEWGLKPGSRLSFVEDQQAKTVKIQPVMTWEELWKKNRAILKRNGITKPLTDDELRRAREEAWTKAATERYERSKS